MKVGDMVTIDVPVGVPSSHKTSRTLYTVQGIIVEKYENVSSRHRTWWNVLRSDTGTVEKYHNGWMEVIK